MGLSMQTLKTQEYTELLSRNKFYNAKYSLQTRIEHGFPIEYTYFPWFIKRRKLHVVKQRKLTLFSWGNIDKLIDSVQLYG